MNDKQSSELFTRFDKKSKKDLLVVFLRKIVSLAAIDLDTNTIDQRETISEQPPDLGPFFCFSDGNFGNYRENHHVYKSSEWK